MRNEVVIRRELPDGGRLILTVETPEALCGWAMASLAPIARAMKDYTDHYESHGELPAKMKGDDGDVR